MLRLDHIVVVAGNLNEGTQFVSDLLSAPMEKGGEHAIMGTHNTLLSLGPNLYLEVIAIDPDAPAPDRPRWFGLDRFSGSPRLTNWVCSSDDLSADHLLAPAGMEEVVNAARGDLRWKMAIPVMGQYPFGGAYPGMIAWQSKLHPCQMLPDRGVRLDQLGIEHPEAHKLSSYLKTLDRSATVEIRQGPEIRLSAQLSTPAGKVRI